MARLLTLLRNSKLVRDTGWSFLIRVAAAGLGFLATVLLARMLGAEGYGHYAYAVAFITLLALPAQAGLPFLLVRETAKGIVSERPATVRGVWTWAGRVTGILSLLLAVGAGSFIFISNDGGLDVRAWTMVWALALVPLVALGNLRGAALRGLDRIVAGQFPEAVLRPAFLVAILGTVALTVGRITAPQAMAFNVLAASLSFGVGAWLLWKHTPPAVRRTGPEFEGRAWLASLLPLALIAGMLTINSQADILMLGIFETSDQIGIYRVAVGAAALGTFGLGAVNSVVAPRFARLHEQGDFERLQRVVTRSARLILFLSLSVVAFFVLFGRPLLGLAFGAEFVASYVPLVILLGGQLVSSTAGSVGQLLNMAGHERDSAKAIVLAAIVNVGLNLLLIPPLGIVGAAIASAVSLSIQNVWLWLAVRRRLGINSLAFGSGTFGSS